MTTATLPGARRSLAGKIASGLAARARAKGRASKAAAVIALARQHIVTAAALASVDVGAFHGGPIAGWVVTGVSLLALDFAVTG